MPNSIAAWGPQALSEVLTARERELESVQAQINDGERSLLPRKRDLVASIRNLKSAITNLAKAKMPPDNPDKAAFGVTVTCMVNGNRIERYTLFGLEEAGYLSQYDSSIISMDCELGQGLLNLTVGESVSVKGYTYKVQSLQPWAPPGTDSSS